MVKRKCWCSKPNFMVCFPHTFVRLSMYCDVRLVSMDGRNWLLPRVFSPVMKMVPRPPFEGTCGRSEEHTSELQSHSDLVCRLLLEKKKKNEQQCTNK